MERVLQLPTRAAGNQPGLLLALACRMQSVLSPLQSFWTGPLRPNPLGLCASGNKLSFPLSSRSWLMPLVVAATLIRLRSGFGSPFWSWDSGQGDQSLHSHRAQLPPSGSARVTCLVLPIFQSPSPWRYLHSCKVHLGVTAEERLVPPAGV